MTKAIILVFLLIILTVKASAEPGFEEHYRDLPKGWLCQSYDMDNNFWHEDAKTQEQARAAAFHRCLKKSPYRTTCTVDINTGCRPKNDKFHLCVVKDIASAHIWTETTERHPSCQTAIHACQHWVFGNPEKCKVVDLF